MKYQINSNNKKAAYLQLYEMLRGDIISGVYRFGDKLPSKRNIAEDGDMSVITVAHAYELLIDEGYAESREKSGYFVTYKVDDFYKVPAKDYDVNSEYDTLISAEFQKENDELLHPAGELSYNILAKTIRRTILNYGEKILDKTPNKGIEDLREEICKYLVRNVGIKAKTSQVVIGAGAEYLYGMVAQLFDVDKSVAIENPSYEKIRRVYERYGYKVDELTLLKDGISQLELEKSNASILHVTPFHSFPSNVSATISKKYEYIRWAGNNRYIIEDNYDSELTVSRKMEDTVYSLANGKNVIYINTFSRTISQSLRVGYMVLPESLLDIFESKLGFYSCTVPAFEQYTLCELLRSGDFERHINRVRRKLRSSM